MRFATLALAPLAMAVPLCLPTASHADKPAPAAPCRALVNLETPGGVHQVADVLLTSPPSVRVVPGLALGVGKAITQVRVVQDASWSKGIDARFGSLVARTASGERTLATGREEIGRPEAGEATPWYADFAVRVTAIAGDLIALDQSSYGYTGGAHDFDDRRARTLHGPTGEEVDMFALLGKPYQVAAEAALAAERSSHEDGWEDGPTITAETLKAARFTLLRGVIRVETAISCCSWAENHGYWELEATIAPPAVLKGLVPDAEGWFDTGTCAVRLDDRGQLFSRQGLVTTLPAGRLLGLAWVDPAAPALAQPKVDEVARKAAFARARAAVGKAEDATVIALLHKALDADPNHPETLGELGYLHLKAKSLDTAEALTQWAMEGPTDAGLDARLRYNLGRIAEARGQLGRARRLYQSSLARRPNPVVKLALAGVEARLK